MGSYTIPPTTWNFPTFPKCRASLSLVEIELPDPRYERVFFSSQSRPREINLHELFDKLCLLIWISSDTSLSVTPFECSLVSPGYLPPPYGELSMVVLLLGFPFRRNSDWSCQNVQKHFILFLLKLLNTLPSFRGLGLSEGGLFCLSLLKTLAIDDGLRECLFPCLLLGSTLAVDVLDSEQCDSS
ncbi:hypothetical protein Tco_0403400 [Tanacetum coccineum]